MVIENVKVNKVVVKGSWVGLKVEGNDNWFSAEGDAQKILNGVKEGNTVKINYTKKGVKQTIDSIEITSEAKGSSEPVEKEVTPLQKAVDAPKQAPKQEYTSGTKYGSAEDIAGKEVGCAAGAAATVVASMVTPAMETKEVLKIYREVVNAVLEHIRALK
jgi:hypothetical protein